MAVARVGKASAGEGRGVSLLARRSAIPWPRDRRGMEVVAVVVVMVGGGGWGELA